MTAIKNGREEGMCEYLIKVRQQLAKAMSYTGCTNLGKMDPSVIHRV
jgi:isopentenyl diphosphate isomerase/L-lactate dehydrogenase-like FMN-dependent dehydrogenase